ncbi:hypothetical protein Q5H93_03485 [Hymenobacter sp. ASUV-10]|uniref:Uncharacterized protein n=1 Tax=Hymenobacter aranciens TaxID=3063996 RepID=A0ABT9B679_9BACT|nr:hypothetical protein [Hymenobacter sp. ASUV-10]MDO7873781.1 hypothetical protein [Hymenobacter sp. ASUV-10]
MDRLQHNTYTLWREVDKRTELAFYLGFDRLHRLPFTPAQYVETGVALRFIELWQLLFIAEDEQADYAEAIGTVVAQVRALFPEALPLLPAHVARYAAPAPAAGPDYRQLFADAIAYLQAVPGVELYAQWGQYWRGLQDDQAPPSFGMTLGTFERLRRETGQPVPGELRAFYGQLDGCTLRWNWADTAERPAGEAQRGGSIDLWPLARVFGGHNSRTVRHWDHRVNDGVLWAVGHADWVPGLAELHPFENIDAEKYPCLRLPATPDAPTDVCWLSGDLDDIYPLQLSFTTYLLRAFACLGVAQWQLLYRTDELTYESPGFAHRIEEDLHRLGLDPNQVLPDRRR